MQLSIRERRLGEVGTPALYPCRQHNEPRTCQDADLEVMVYKCFSIIYARTTCASQLGIVLLLQVPCISSPLTESSVPLLRAQNPLSQLGIVLLRDGIAERLTDLSGSPEAQLRRLDAANLGVPRVNSSCGVPQKNCAAMGGSCLFTEPTHRVL